VVVGLPFPSVVVDALGDLDLPAEVGAVAYLGEVA
jgi:hypothetical protein